MLISLCYSETKLAVQDAKETTIHIRTVSFLFWWLKWEKDLYQIKIKAGKQQSSTNLKWNKLVRYQWTECVKHIVKLQRHHIITNQRTYIIKSFVVVAIFFSLALCLCVCELNRFVRLSLKYSFIYKLYDRQKKNGMRVINCIQREEKKINLRFIVVMLYNIL